MNKSFLKWAGGKSKSIDFIKNALPSKIERLVEPFVGSGVVSLNIDADSYLLADYNKDIINVFSTLKKERKDFVEYCKTFFNSKGLCEDVYYYNRDRFNFLPLGRDRAALFIYLNRHCYNGLCRYNLSGKFNVPYGKYKSVYFPENEMLYFIEKSQRFEFICADFLDTFSKCNGSDVIYCDPPYIPLNTTSSFTNYTDKGFSFEMQKALVDCAKDADCKVLISNHWIPGVTEDLYMDGDTSLRKDINRSISAKASSRCKVEEVLVIYN